MQKFMISAIGKDQPGIVGAVTQVLFENACNLEDSSMTLLEDYFTMLFIVLAPPNLTLANLEQKLKQELQAFEMQLALHLISTDEENPSPKGRPWMLSVSGLDQTGIMYHVTTYLGSQRINIHHLSSKRLSRASGEILFLMALEVEVPEALSDSALQQDLNKLAADNQLEIHAEPLEVYTL